MAPNPSVKMTGVNKLAESIGAHDLKVKRLIASEFKYAEQEAPGIMKENAPWTDDSGNARAGLHAKAESINQGAAFDLILAHTVYYGIWLEVRFSGKYAILMPTANYIGALMMERIASGIAKLEAMQ